MKELQRDGHDGDESRSYIGNSSTRNIAVFFELEANGDFRVNQDTKTSWSIGTTYKLRAYNIDWENTAFDWEFIDYANKNVLASSSGESFFNTNTSSLDLVHYGMSNGGSGGTVETLYDNLSIVL